MIDPLDALRARLTKLKADERHHSVKETRYWCDQYRLFAESMFEVLEPRARAQQELLRCHDELTRLGVPKEYRLEHRIVLLGERLAAVEAENVKLRS